MTGVLIALKSCVRGRPGNAAYLYECSCGDGGQQEVGGFLSSLSFSRDPGEPFPSRIGTNIMRFSNTNILICIMYILISKIRV